MNARAAPLIIQGGSVITLDDAGTVHPCGDVLVEGDRIRQVGSVPESAAAGARRLDASGAVVLPGFVQTHVHLCQALFRNQAEELGLLDWLRCRIWPLEAAHDPETLAASADLGLAELLLGGTTSLLDMATVHHTEVVFQRAEAMGIRLTGGKALMDCGDGVPAGLLEQTAAACEENRQLARAWHGQAGGRLRYAHCPRFILSCSDELLAALPGEMAEDGVLMHTHAAEHPSEVPLVRARTGASGIEALELRDLLGPRTCLAHCIQVSKTDLQLLARTGTAVAHCPSSNLKLGSGVCDVPALLAAGIRVGLGADGAPCNNRLSMFTEMRLAALLQVPVYGPGVLSAGRVLELATREGAAILGLENRIGSLEAGKQADLVVIDLEQPHTAPAPPLDRLAEVLVHAATPGCVRHTLVDGEVLVENHTLTRVDRQRIVAEAQRLLPRCLTRAGLAR
jgi:cytosine/adenosine deaminase-related metal-dependent hydrolase